MRGLCDLLKDQLKEVHELNCAQEGAESAREHQAALLHCSPELLVKSLPLCSTSADLNHLHPFGFPAVGSVIQEFVQDVSSIEPDSERRVRSWIQASGTGKTRSLYELQRHKSVIMLALRLTRNAHAHGDRDESRLVPVWRACAGRSREARCFSHHPEFVQAEIMTGILAHILWIILVFQYALGASKDEIEKIVQQGLPVFGPRTTEGVEHRISDCRVLRQAYVTVTRNGRAESGIETIFQSLLSSKRFAVDATNAELRTGRRAQRNFWPLQLDKVKEEVQCSLNYLFRLDEWLSAVRRPADASGAPTSEPAEVMEPATRRVCVAFDEVQVTQTAVYDGESKRDWFEEWQAVMQTMLSTRLCASVVLCGTTFGLWHAIDKLSSPLRQLSKPFYKRHVFTGDELCEQVSQVLALPETGPAADAWREAVSRLQGRPMWLYDRFWPQFVATCRGRNTTIVSAEELADEVVKIADSAVSDAIETLETTFLGFTRRLVAHDDPTPSSVFFRSLYLCAKLARTRMYCTEPQAETFLQAAAPMKVSGSTGSTGTGRSWSVSLDEEPLFHKTLLSFGDTKYLGARLAGQEDEVSDTRHFVGLLDDWYFALSQPGTCIDGVKGESFERVSLLTLLRLGFEKDTSLYKLLAPLLGEKTGWRDIDVMTKLKVHLRRGYQATNDTQHATSFHHMINAHKLPRDDCVFFGLDCAAGPDLAFWAYEVEAEVRVRYRLIIIQCKGRQHAALRSMTKSLNIQQRAYKDFKVKRTGLQQLLDAEPFRQSRILVTCNVGGYTKTVHQNSLKLALQQPSATFLLPLSLPLSGSPLGDLLDKACRSASTSTCRTTVKLGKLQRLRSLLGLDWIL